MTDPVLPPAATTQEESPHEHVSTLGQSVAIWAALIVCTILTAAVAFVDLGPANTVVALGIATFKAILVVLFFMHVKYTHEKLTGLVIASAIFFLFILLSLSMADFATRLWR
jgi:cytochrome c oxidase subunit IV